MNKTLEGGAALIMLISGSSKSKGSEAELEHIPTKEGGS